MTIMRMIQSFGRSTRRSGDKSTTYCLDLKTEKLFDSKNNDWKNIKLEYPHTSNPETNLELIFVSVTTHFQPSCSLSTHRILTH